ncbi:MAG: pilus assembly protein PilM, partial [Lentisphaeria bacterium]|nr:pilus assembly protein PilM [Lentisphaeria bacterium]
MAVNNYVLCLDVGGTTVKAAEYLYSAAGEMILEKFAFSDYGRDIEDDATEESAEKHRTMMADAVRAIITENNFKAKRVDLCLSGKSAYIKFVKLPSMVSDEKKLRQIIEFEAASAIPFDLDGVIWDSQIISKDAERGEIEAMFVVVKRDDLEFITDVVEKLGKEISLIDVAPTAIYNAAKANGIGVDNCELLLNIGGSCSLLIFADKGRFFTRLIPIAGNAVTHQISKEFGI